jgi:hypothetical protein
LKVPLSKSVRSGDILSELGEERSAGTEGGLAQVKCTKPDGGSAKLVVA